MSGDKNWWLKESIRFECQPDCFKCCSKPGVVFMTPAEATQAANYIDVPLSWFKKEFLSLQGDLYLIEVKDDKPCPFLTDEGCAIHETKPSQCRTYPFWQENMESKNHWELTSVFCPGIGKGPKITKKEITKCLEEEIRF
tara:strand:+ start:266 stop:685 length:420 start_codon:yes stop_codon:yes gene_type:complete